MFLFKLKPRRNLELGVLAVVLQKVWVFMFLHAECCDGRFTHSRSLQTYSMRSSHQSTVFFFPVSLVCERKKNRAGGLGALMDLLACVGLGRLLTTQLRTLIFIILHCVDFRPLT